MRVLTHHRAFLRLGQVIVPVLFALAISAACARLHSAINKIANRSQGKLVANVGMSLDEIQNRSTLKLEPAVCYPTGERMTAAGAWFDFEIAGTAIRFNGCRYYWLMTGKQDDLKLRNVIIGVSPEKLDVEALAAAGERCKDRRS